MLAVHGGGGTDSRSLRKGHSLPLIVQVSVLGNRLISGIERFKDHHGLALQASGVKGEWDINTPLAVRSKKSGLGGDGSFSVHHGFPGFFQHHLAHDMVLLARDQAAVLHFIHDGDLPRGGGRVLAVHSGGGANLRLGETDRLPLVLNVLVGGHFRIPLEQLFKNHDGFSG